MKRTAIYMRVSTEKQAKEGDSISAQRDALRSYVASHEGLVLAGEYLDDGASGTKNDRDELQRLLADVRSGKVDLILVTKMDRLHRSLRNFLNMQDVLDSCHCDWMAIWEPMYDSSTPQGRMVINTMMNLAQFEAEQTAQRVSQVFEHKVANGEVIGGTIPPFGFSREGKHLVPGEDAWKVRAIFDHFDSCGGLLDTVRFASSLGYSRSYDMIRQLLMNEKYAGSFRGNPSFCEPIVDRSLFDRVQRVLSMNVKCSQKYPYIFSGLVVCAVCGWKYRGTYPKGTAYYRCSHTYNRGCPNHYHLSEPKLEKHLLGLLPEMVERMTVKASPSESRQTAEERRAVIRRKMERLQDLYVDGEISRAKYKTQSAVLRSDLESIEDDPVVDASVAEALSGMTGGEIYGTFSNEEKRSFWRILLRRVEVDQDGSLRPVWVIA